MSTLPQWQRIRLNPAAAKTWNRAGELTIDFDVRIEDKPHEVLQWLELFDGTRSTQQLLESAAAIGIDVARATSHFRELSHHGAIFEVDTIPAALGDTRTMYDTRATGLMFEKSGLEIAADRQALRVCVVGIGVIAHQLTSSLESLGYLTGWSIESTTRITDEDAHLCGMPQNMIGRRWMDLGRKIQNPHLVVVIDDVIDMTQIDLQYSEAKILPVHIRTQQIEIGPLLHSPRSVCAECIYELQKQATSDWPMMLTQLLHHRRAQPLIPIAVASLVGAQILLLIHHVASGQQAPLTNTSMMLKSDDVTWKEREWKRHISVECRCDELERVD